jgi:hypothetical protein
MKSIFRKLAGQLSKKQSDEEDLQNQGMAAWAIRLFNKR